MAKSTRSTQPQIPAHVNQVPETPANPAPEPLTPDEHVAMWEKSLRHSTVAEVEYLQYMFGDLSNGEVSPYLERCAQLIFSRLIANEELELFVDLFNTYHHVMGRQQGTPDAPYRSSLEIRLPNDWAPKHHTATEMAEFFSRIHAQDVTVDKGSSDPWDGVHEALTPCLIALLKNGTTSLQILTPLASPALLAEALPGSALERVQLGDTDVFDRPLPAEALKSYEVLMSGLTTCRTLTRLELGNAQLLSLHRVFASFNDPHGPRLTSVAFQGYSRQEAMAGNFVDFTPAFVQKIGTSPSLQVVEAKAPLANTRYLQTAFLNPLSGHQRLTRLKVTDGVHTPSPTQHVLPMAIVFAKTCPSLKAFHYSVGQVNEGVDVVDYMDGLQQLGLPLESALIAQAMEDAITDARNLGLESLRINGVFVPEKALEKLTSALRPGGPLQSIRDLNLRDCAMGLRPAIDLVNALVAHPTFNTIKMPDHGGYHIRTNNGRLHALAEKAFDDEEDARGVGPEFQLALRVDVDEATRAEVNTEFHQLEAQANALLINPQEQRDALLARQLGAQTHPGLMLNVAGLLRSAYAQQHELEPGKVAYQFMGESAEIMAYLGTAHSIETTALLPLVSKHVNENRGIPPRADLAALVALDRRNGGGLSTPSTSTATTTTTTTSSTTTTTTTGTTTTTTTAPAAEGLNATNERQDPPNS